MWGPTLKCFSTKGIWFKIELGAWVILKMSQGNYWKMFKYLYSSVAFKVMMILISEMSTVIKTYSSFELL